MQLVDLRGLLYQNNLRFEGYSPDVRFAGEEPLFLTSSQLFAQPHHPFSRRFPLKRRDILPSLQHLVRATLTV